jgi:hypothetical protein
MYIRRLVYGGGRFLALGVTGSQGWVVYKSDNGGETWAEIQAANSKE